MRIIFRYMNSFVHPPPYQIHSGHQTGHGYTLEGPYMTLVPGTCRIIMTRWFKWNSGLIIDVMLAQNKRLTLLQSHPHPSLWQLLKGACNFSASSQTACWPPLFVPRCITAGEACEERWRVIQNTERRSKNMALRMKIPNMLVSGNWLSIRVSTGDFPELGLVIAHQVVHTVLGSMFDVWLLFANTRKDDVLRRDIMVEYHWDFSLKDFAGVVVMELDKNLKQRPFLIIQINQCGIVNLNGFTLTAHQHFHWSISDGPVNKFPKDLSFLM